MLKRNLVLRLVSALAIASAVGLLPAVTYAAGSSAAITKPPAGMGSVVLINQESGNEALTVNLNGNSYTVPAQGGSSASQVEFNLAPGSYTYNASAPGIAPINESVNVTAGKVTSLTFQPNSADDLNGAQDADDAAQTQLVTVNGGEEHEVKKDDKDKSSTSDKPSTRKVKKSDNGDGPDGDDTHLVSVPGTVNDNDDLVVTVGDLTSQAQ